MSVFDIIIVFCVLGFPAAIAYEKISVAVKDETLTKCVVRIIQDWDSNKYLLNVNIIKIDDEINIPEIQKIKGVRFIIGECAWGRNCSKDVIIILAESYMDLVERVNKIATNVLWNPQQKIILILKNAKDYDLPNVANIFVHHNLFDIIFIFHQHGDYEIYKCNTTSNNNCNISDNLMLMSSCSGYLNSKSLLFQERFPNIRNGHFKFFARVAWPYTNFYSTKLLGIDQRILKLFEKYEGVKIDSHITPTITDRYGRVIPHYVDRMLKKVEENEFEGAFGGLLLTLNRTEKLSFTYPILIYRRVVVLAHANNLGPWTAVFKKAFYTFLVSGIVLIILCIAARVVIIFPSQNKDITRDILLVLGYVTNTIRVVNTNPKLAQRIIFSCLLWLSLLLPCMIQVNLYGSITRPIQGYEPKKLDEMTGYTAMVYSGFPENHGFKEIECKAWHKCLLEIKNSNTKSLFTIVTQIYLYGVASILQDEHCNLKVYALKDSYDLEFQTIYLRRGSALLHRYNKFILRVSAAGIIAEYYRDVKNFERMQCIYHNNNQKSIKLGDIYVFLLILVLGYVISLIIFFGELIFGTHNLFSC